MQVPVAIGLMAIHWPLIAFFSIGIIKSDFALGSAPISAILEEAAQATSEAELMVLGGLIILHLAMAAFKTPCARQQRGRRRIQNPDERGERKRRTQLAWHLRSGWQVTSAMRDDPNQAVGPDLVPR